MKTFGYNRNIHEYNEGLHCKVFKNLYLLIMESNTSEANRESFTVRESTGIVWTPVLHSS